MEEEEIAELDLAQANPYKDAEKRASQPAAPSAPKPPTDSKDILEGLDTSTARPRHKHTPEENKEIAKRRKESVDRHRGWGHDVWPGTPSDWQSLLKSMSPTHLDWAINLHKKLKDAGFPKGLATPPGELQKTPGALDAIRLLMQHSVPKWLGEADPDKHKPKERAPSPGQEFFTPPSGIGPKGGELKEFDDVIPSLGGRRFAMEDEAPMEAPG